MLMLITFSGRDFFKTSSKFAGPFEQAHLLEVGVCGAKSKHWKNRSHRLFRNPEFALAEQDLCGGVVW